MSIFLAPPTEVIIYRNATLLVNLGSAFLSLTTISCILRVWTRTKLVACCGEDDWVILLTQVCFTVMCGLLFKRAGHERDLATAPGSSHFAQAYDLLLIETAMYLVTILLLEASLALFFLRFIIERWAKLTVCAITIVFSVWTFAVLLITIFYCGNPKNTLEKSMEDQCIPSGKLLLSGIIWGIYNTMTDWFFALLPLAFVLRSRLPLTTKISVGVIMVIAAVGSSAGIPGIRNYNLLQGSENFWIISTRFLTWSIIKPGIGLFAANLAALRPSLDRALRLCSNQASSVRTGNVHDKVRSDRVTLQRKSNLQISGLEVHSGITGVTGDQPWETGLNFVTAKTFNDVLSTLEKGCYKRVPSTLVDWTIGQQAFNACMILLLDAINCESLDRIERVEVAYKIFVEMDQAKMHQLTGLAMSQIGEDLAHVRAAHESHKLSVNAEAISRMSAQIPQNSYDGYATDPFECETRGKT